MIGASKEILWGVPCGHWRPTITKHSFNINKLAQNEVGMASASRAGDASKKLYEVPCVCQERPSINVKRPFDGHSVTSVLTSPRVEHQRRTTEGEASNYDKVSGGFGEGRRAASVALPCRMPT